MIQSSSPIIITEAKQDLLCVDSLLEQILPCPVNFMRIYKNTFSLAWSARWSPLAFVDPVTPTPPPPRPGMPFPRLFHLINIWSSRRLSSPSFSSLGIYWVAHLCQALCLGSSRGQTWKQTITACVAAPIPRRRHHLPFSFSQAALAISTFVYSLIITIVIHCAYISCYHLADKLL